MFLCAYPLHTSHRELTTAMSVFSKPLLYLAALGGVAALDNGLALTPQMGWNTWNHFGCNISEDTILSGAKALVSNNLAALGYNCGFQKHRS